MGSNRTLVWTLEVGGGSWNGVRNSLSMGKVCMFILGIASCRERAFWWHECLWDSLISPLFEAKAPVKTRSPLVTKSISVF